MTWQQGDILRCNAVTCQASMELTSKDRIWVARSRGWGVIKDITLCPDHSGRQREKRQPLRAVLPGDQPLFNLPTGAVVEKKSRKSKKVTS